MCDARMFRVIKLICNSGDELWEVICARQLGVGRSGPICLVNTDGYYDGFASQIKRAHEDQILHKPPSEFVHVSCTHAVLAYRWPICLYWSVTVDKPAHYSAVSGWFGQIATDPIAALDWCEEHMKDLPRQMYSYQSEKSSFNTNVKWLLLGGVAGVLTSFVILRPR